MHIAFSALFFLIVGLRETHRLGLFGLTGAEAQMMVLAAMAIAAALILRADTAFLFRVPRALYGRVELNWAPARTLLAVVLAPVVLILPVFRSGALTQINPDLFAWQMVAQLSGPVILSAVVYELFLREAVLKAFSAALPGAFLVTALASFILALPGGGMVAVMAAGWGVYLMALRCAGCHVLVLGIVHAVLMAAHGILVTGEVSPGYAIYFTVGAAALALTIMALVGQKHREAFSHA